MKKLMYLTLAALLVMSSVALAQPGCGGRGQGDSPGWNRPEKPGAGHEMATWGGRGCCEKPGWCCSGGSGHCEGMGHGKPGVRMLLSMAEEIGLTDEQKTKLEKMMVDFKLAKVDQKSRVEKAKIRLRALMRDENANENEVMAGMDEVARMKAELHKMCYRHHKQVRDLLTQEQIDKLKKLRKEKMKKCKGQYQGPHQGMRSGSSPCRFGFSPSSDK